MKTILKLMPAVLIAVSLSSCSDDENGPVESPSKVSYGKETTVGKGVVRTFVIKKENGEPESYGLTFTEGALEGHPMAGASTIIPMPEGHGTLINHVSFDYATHHHAPMYNTEHLTAHFYYISEQEKQAIKASSPAMEVLPPAEFHPKDYIPTPGGADRMGKHWPDTTAEELHGKPFKRSLVVGSYNGEFIFIEPLINMEFLKSKPNSEWPVKDQAKVQRAGFYPSIYALSYDQTSKLYSLTFKNLNKRSN